jgi:hypothetical protein
VIYQEYSHGSRHTIQNLNTRWVSCAENTTASPELWTQEKRVTGRSL